MLTFQHKEICMKKTMKNDSCLTVSRRAAIIRQDAEENYGTLLTPPISACNEQTEPAFPLHGH